MGYTKEEYVNEIKRYLVLLKQHKVKDTTYTVIQRELIKILSEYYTEHVLKGKMREVGLEFVQTAQACLHSYCADKGDFLHYFNVALKKSINTARAKENQSIIRQGVVISCYEDRLIRKMLRYAKLKNIDLHTENGTKLVAKFLQLPYEKARNLIKMNENAVVVSNIVKDSNEESVDLFDTISSKKELCDEVAQFDEIVQTITLMDKLFCGLPKREKSNRIISMYLTAKVIESNEQYFDKLRDIITSSMFCNDIVLDTYINENRILSQLEMAEMCCMSQQSASRTLREFKRKLYDVLQKSKDNN